MDLGKLRELSHHRVCQDCGAEFETILGTKTDQEIPALAQFCDHIVIHNPDSTQWQKAHELIQKQKERSSG